MTWESRYAQAHQSVRQRSAKRQQQTGLLRIYTPEEVEAFARERGERAAKRGVLRHAYRLAKAG